MKLNTENINIELPPKIPYLKMLILFGSQSRGDTHNNSDWDFAALYDQKMRNKYCENNAFLWFEVSAILGDIFNLNPDHIDVIDLDNCSLLISHAIARDGQLIWEREVGLFDKFKKQFLLSEQKKNEIKQNLEEKINHFLHQRGIA